MVQLKSKALLWLACIGTVFSLSACDQSDVPLSAPSVSAYDEQIVGDWHGKVNGTDVYLHAIPESKPFIRLFRVVNTHGGKYYNSDQVDAFTSVVGKSKFLNVKFPGGGPDKGKTKEVYWYYKYEVSPSGELTVWQLDHADLKKAISKKRLAGRFDESDPENPIFTLKDSAEHIRTFLQSDSRALKVYGKFKHQIDTP